DMARMAVELFDETSDPVKAARLRERLGWAVYLAGDLPGGTRLLEEAARRLEGKSPSPEKASILAGLANFTMYAGNYRGAIPIAERAVASGRASGARASEIEAMSALGSSL